MSEPKKLIIVAHNDYDDKQQGEKVNQKMNIGVQSNCGDLLVPLDDLRIGVSVSAAAREAIGVDKSTKGITALEEW